jgi:hypothetical protein
MTQAELRSTLKAGACSLSGMRTLGRMVAKRMNVLGCVGRRRRGHDTARDEKLAVRNKEHDKLGQGRYTKSGLLRHVSSQGGSTAGVLRCSERPFSISEGEVGNTTRPVDISTLGWPTSLHAHLCYPLPPRRPYAKRGRDIHRGVIGLKHSWGKGFGRDWRWGQRWSTQAGSGMRLRA